MLSIAATIEDLLVAAMIGEKTLPRKSTTEWAFRGLSVLLGGAGVFLSVLALTRFFDMRYAADMAALISAVAVFLAAFLAASISRRYRREKTSGLNAARDELGKNIHSLIQGICSELDEPIRENPKTAMLLASLAGFLTARHNY